MRKKGSLIVISGPSGAGKGTVLDSLFKRIPSLKYSVSATTRDPRPGEKEGVNYFFIAKKTFESWIKEGKLLEYAAYCDNYYGTPREFVETQRNAGKDIVLEIDLCGARQIKEKCPDAILIFIAPPSLEELERRLLLRNTETPEEIKRRVDRAREEMKSIAFYDYSVVNDDLESAIQKVEKIIEESRG